MISHVERGEGRGGGGGLGREPWRWWGASGAGGGRRPVPGSPAAVSSGPPPGRPGSAVVRVTVAGVWAMWGPSLTYTL